MSNLDAIKEYDLDNMALLLAQITSCATCSNYIPDRERWREYLLGNSMFLPFSEYEHDINKDTVSK